MIRVYSPVASFSALMVLKAYSRFYSHRLLQESHSALKIAASVV